MIQYVAAFSNRELAIILWIVIVLALLLLFKGTRQAIRNMVIEISQIALHSFIFPSFLILAGYMVVLLLLLSHFPFWNVGLLKDTVIWFLFAGLPTCFNVVNEYKKTGYFKKIIVANLKFIVLVEYVTSYYTFSFLVEMILIPILFFVVLLEVIYKNKKEFPLTHRFFSLLETLLSLLIIGYAVVRTFSDWRNLGTVESIASLLLPLILTLAFLPFTYFLAVGSAYSDINVRIKMNRTVPIKVKKNMRKKVAKYCGLRLSKLREFEKQHRVQLSLVKNEDEFNCIFLE